MVWSSRFVQHGGKVSALGLASLWLVTGCGATAAPPPATPPPGQYAPLNAPEPATDPVAPEEPVAEPPPAEAPFVCPEPPEGLPAAPAQGPRVAIVLLIDRSSSMKGAAHDKAKEAALGALAVLRPDDWLGIVGYEKVARTYVQAQPAQAKGRIRIHIRRMGTDRTPSRLDKAFDLARENLDLVAAKREHVVILTNSDLDQAAADAALVLAKTGATISMLAFGEGPNKERAACLPRVGRGETVWLDSPDALPEQLRKEIERVLAP